MSLSEAVAAALGAPVANLRRLHGGDLSEVLALHLRDGRDVIAKTGPAPQTEAAMLTALRKAGAPVPEVLAAGPWGMVMTQVPDDGSRAGDLGAVLCRLHQTTGSRYGWEMDYAFGAVPIANGWHNDWADFWAERRLRPFLPHLSAGMARRLEQVCDRIGADLPAMPAPSLLHGDLWRGNILTHGGQVSGLIDPACYYGHGEVDLAMLHLFGGAEAGFEAAYGALPPGWERRRLIYQLWPALVHVRLFGSGYMPMLDRLLNRLQL